MTIPSVHTTYVKTTNGAGQRNHRGQCYGCLWHGVTTTDKQRAQDEADGHAVEKASVL